MALQVALRNLSTPVALEAYWRIAERALLNQTDVQLFEHLLRFDDPLDEIESWLRDRAHMHSHIQLCAQIDGELPIVL